jgi:hypothetical protein
MRYLDDKLEDLVEGKAEPLVERDGSVAVLVHLLEHLLPLGGRSERRRQSQPDSEKKSHFRENFAAKIDKKTGFKKLKICVLEFNLASLYDCLQIQS